MEEFAVGDEVFGIAPGCLGRSVVVPAQLLVPKPPGVGFVDAATTPTTYVTVYTAFGELASMTPGTKVGLAGNQPPCMRLAGCGRATIWVSGKACGVCFL